MLVLHQALFAGVSEDDLELASVSLPSAVRNVHLMTEQVRVDVSAQFRFAGVMLGDFLHHPQ